MKDDPLFGLYGKKPQLCDTVDKLLKTGPMLTRRSSDKPSNSFKSVMKFTKPYQASEGK